MSQGRQSEESDETRSRWLVPAIVLLSLLIFLPGLGQRDLWFPDEPDVAEPAISMFRTGDWVVPRHNDQPWADYPPMTYWLGAISSTIAGEPTPLALRMPIALMGALLIGLTACVALRSVGLWAGWIAGLVLLSSSHFVLQSTNFHPDMAFALAIAGGVTAYGYGSLQTRVPASWGWRILGFALLGAAVLSKGPLGLLLPGLVLGLWHLSAKQWRAIAEMVPLTFVALAVSLPWYAAFADAIGAGTVWEEIYRQNFARFVAGARGHQQPPYYFLVNIWHNLLPWSFLIPIALVHAVRKRWDDGPHRLAVISFVTSFVFLSIATTKREVYLLPVYPAIAFLVGSYLDHAIRLGGKALRWWAMATGALLVSLGLILPWLGTRFGEATLGSDGMASRGPTLAEQLQGPIFILQIVLLLGGAAMIFVNRRGLTHRGVLTVAGGMAAVYVTLNVCILPPLDSVNSYRPAAIWLREISGTERIGYYLPGAQLKPCGFRVGDPAYLPLQMFEAPSEVAEYLTGSSRLVVLRADRLVELTDAEPKLEQLPRRLLELGNNEFLVLGHGVTQ